MLCRAVLLQAGRLFKQLEDMGQEPLKKGGLDFKKVQLHAKFCADNTPKVGIVLYADSTPAGVSHLQQEPGCMGQRTGYIHVVCCA